MGRGGEGRRAVRVRRWGGGGGALGWGIGEREVVLGFNLGKEQGEGLGDECVMSWVMGG